MVLGERMEDPLRFAICYWHGFAWNGFDVFGYDGSFQRPWHPMTDPWKAALAMADTAFDFFVELGAPYYCFHDRDVAPEGKTPRQSATDPNLEVFALAALQVEQAMEVEVACCKPVLLSYQIRA